LIKTRKIKRFILFIIFTGAVGISALTGVSAVEVADTLEIPDFGGIVGEILDLADELGSPERASDSVNIMIFLTIIALAPSILVLMTGFTRILIVLSFVRNALGLQQTPPTQVLLGIALFLTIFLMAPVFSQMNEEALQPYINEELSIDEAFAAAMQPMRDFMFRQLSATAMGAQDLNTFLSLANEPTPEVIDDIGNEVLIPAFIMGEIRRAFMIGFLIYVPFLIIDLVVASTLMSLGMMMLPPAMVSMPFKLILFMLVDGWNLITVNLMATFY